MKRIVLLFNRIGKSNNPLISIDVAMLVLRIGVGMLIFINHGIEKIFSFNQMLETFPDPIGIGRLPGLLFALIADGVCTVMIAIGFFTRISSLLICINLLAAFILVHKGNIVDTHGELATIYFVASLFIFLYGSGKISIHKMSTEYHK